jgi:hypothetical protein
MIEETIFIVLLIFFFVAGLLQIWTAVKMHIYMNKIRAFYEESPRVAQMIIDAGLFE